MTLIMTKNHMKFITITENINNMKNFKVTSGYVTQYTHKGEFYETFDVDRFKSIKKMLLLVHLKG